MKKVWFIIITAVIALTVFLLLILKSLSNETLEVFEELNEKIVESNEVISRENDSILRTYSEKGYAHQLEKVRTLDSASIRFINYLEDLKTSMRGSIDSQDFESMDKSTYIDSLFFAGDSITQEGNEFLIEMSTYKEVVSETFLDEFPDVINTAMAEFDTTNVTNTSGTQVNWLRYNYEGFPMIASMTKFTALQNDVKMVQREILENILRAEK